MHHIMTPIGFSMEYVTRGHKDERIVCSDDMQLQLIYILLYSSLMHWEGRCMQWWGNQTIIAKYLKYPGHIKTNCFYML